MTPAIELLQKLGITHRVIEYDHDPSNISYGDEAVAATGVDATAVFKTLMVELDDGSMAVGVVPVAARLDLKAIAAAAHSKRATMADPSRAERRSGYVTGGISPFGQKHQCPVFVDEWATALDFVYCSGGRRGLEIEVSPDAFTDVLDAEFAPIASWP